MDMYLDVVMLWNNYNCFTHFWGKDSKPWGSMCQSKDSTCPKSMGNKNQPQDVGGVILETSASADYIHHGKAPLISSPCSVTASSSLWCRNSASRPQIWRGDPRWEFLAGEPKKKGASWVNMRVQVFTVFNNQIHLASLNQTAMSLGVSVSVVLCCSSRSLAIETNVHTIYTYTYY